MTTTMRTSPVTPRKFTEGARVRIHGSDDQVLALFGRELVGVSGIVLTPTRRRFGVNRYRVRFPAHTYITPVKRLERQIAEIECVIREDELELEEEAQS